MLLLAEKIIEQRIIDNYEAIQIVKRELAEKLIDEMMKEDLIKIMITDEGINAEQGTLNTKIRATVRVYHPDT